MMACLKRNFCRSWVFVVLGFPAGLGFSQDGAGVTYQISQNGLERTYVLHEPSGRRKGERCPVLFLWLGGGHQLSGSRWPEFQERTGVKCEDINGPEKIWRFLSQHRRRGP